MPGSLLSAIIAALTRTLILLHFFDVQYAANQTYEMILKSNTCFKRYKVTGEMAQQVKVLVT